MKNIFILILFFFVLNCTKKSNLEIDVDELKKEGTVIHKSFNIEEEDFANINKIALNKIVSNNDTNSDNSILSSSNLIRHLNLNLKFSSLEKKEYFDETNNIFQKKITKSQNKILYVDNSGTLFILDTNLRIVKKIILPNSKPHKNYLLKFSLLVKNDILYLSDNLGSIFAVDLTKEIILWNKNYSVPFLSNLAIYNDSIFVTNSNGKIFSLNITNGEQNWSFETGTTSIKSDHAFKIFIYKNFLIFSNDLGLIYCIDLQKQNVMWDYNIPQSAQKINHQLLKLSNLVIENNFLYFASSLGKIVKIDINNSSASWTAEIESELTPLVNPETVVSVDYKGALYILDKNNGKILFKKNIVKFLKENNKKKIKFTKFNNIFLDSGKIYLTSADGFFISINASNLNEIKFYNLLNEINSDLEILNDHIFFIGNKNYIYKIK